MHWLKLKQPPLPSTGNWGIAFIVVGFLIWVWFLIGGVAPSTTPRQEPLPVRCVIQRVLDTGSTWKLYKQEEVPCP